MNMCTKILKVSLPNLVNLTSLLTSCALQLWWIWPEDGGELFKRLLAKKLGIDLQQLRHEIFAKARYLSLKWRASSVDNMTPATAAPLPLDPGMIDLVILSGAATIVQRPGQMVVTLPVRHHILRILHCFARIPQILS